MDFDRLKLLEQKVEIMQKEFNEVLQEMQVTMQSMAVTYKTVFTDIVGRLNELEAQVGPKPIRQDDEGKEL